MEQIEHRAIFSSRRTLIEAAFAPFPIACFTLTLFTDLAYWQTGNLMWQNFSEWLLFVGIVLGVLTIVSVALGSLFRSLPTRWPYLIGMTLVLVVAFVNNLVHAGDGWTAVVPYGLVLSAITVCLLIATSLIDRHRAHHHDIRGPIHV